MTTLNPGYALLGRIGSEPMMLAPQYGGVGATLRRMLTLDENAEAGQAAQDSFLSAYAALWGDDRSERKPYAFASGMAIIPVHGTLINRFNGTWGFVTGYDYIRGAFDAALADPAVQGIMLDVDSYGGEVHGCFELSDHIHAMRGKKPVRAMVNANCYSAAYATASAADNITVTPSGGAGSIGVVTMHVDYSKALEEAGISVSFIYAGKHKVDGNPYEPLPDGVRADIQTRIDATYQKFVATVARNRGIGEAAVRATEARCYTADDAKAKGLIDAVAPPKAAFAGFANELSGSPSQEFDEMSTTENKQTSTAADESAAAATPAVETAVAAAPAVEAAAPAAPAAEAAAPAAGPSEKDRIKAILSCDEAKDRADLANHLALNTDLSVEDAKGILAASPAAGAAAEANAFAAAMNASPHPEVGSESTEAAEASEPKGAARIMANYAKATGYSLN